MAREVQALNDIEAVTGIRPTFAPYNIGDPNFGLPAANDMLVNPGKDVSLEEDDIPLDTDFIPPF